MNKFLLISFFLLVSINLEAQTTIKLHKSPDQLIEESLRKENLDTNFKNDDLIVVVDDLIVVEEDAEIQTDAAVNKKENTILTFEEAQEVTTENDINFSDLWLEFDKKELIFLLQNTYNINSPILKNELLSILGNDDASYNNVDVEDFNKLIIDTLLNLGNRKKSYKLIQSFGEITNKDINNFYIEFNLNYLLSTNNISEACEYRKAINDMDLVSSNNFFLELDIFCLSLQEKFDEANLLNDVLNEIANKQDQYFQFLFEAMQGIKASNDAATLEIQQMKIIYFYTVQCIELEIYLFQINFFY